MYLYIGCIITCALAMNLTGYAGVAMVVLIFFFEVTSLRDVVVVQATQTNTKC